MNQINETLYALNKDGSFQEWKVFVDGASILVQFGKVNGKAQTKTTLCEPKNIGRANETTGEQQAELEAISKWEKQYRLGYRKTTDELKTEENFSPMLAHDSIKRSHDIIYPCYVQPKLDGVRCVVTFDEAGEPVFNSRGNKTYPLQGKIVEQIKNLRDETGFDMFDGEVYIHGLSLQKILSLTKKWRDVTGVETSIDDEFRKELKKWNKLTQAEKSVSKEPERNDNKYGGYCSEDLQFHIFDIPVNYSSPWYDPDEPAFTRYADLGSVARTVDEGEEKYSHLRIVGGEFVDSEEEVKNLIAVHMQNNYEGAIIRNFIGLYEFGQRSSDLQKWKIFMTAEAKVTGSREDKNGEGVLECEEQDGTTFNCKIKGTFAERKHSVTLKLIGKFITFSYQARTDDGVPQFPVGICERDIDPITWEPNE